jgi:rubredoxin
MMAKYECKVCGFIYDEEAGHPASGVAAGTPWAEVPEDWECPICGQPKAVFKLVEE